MADSDPTAPKTPADDWQAPFLPHVERDFDLRTAFPDYVDYFDDWRCRGAAARQALKASLDLPYGPGQRERFDFFPARRPGRPLLVFIHGGYWRSMDKSDFSWVAAPLVEHDVNVALLNYPLTPDVGIFEIVERVRTGCQWLHRNAARLGADEAGLHLLGWSAGAHLAMMTAARQPAGCEADAQDLPVRSVLAISGIYDLYPLRHTSANAGFRLDHRQAERCSPLYLPRPPDTRLAIVWGERETASFRSQSAALADAWDAERRMQVAGCHHYAVMAELASRTSRILALELELIDAASGPQEPGGGAGTPAARR